MNKIELKNLCCIVVPIYKTLPTHIEIASFRQLLKVLSKYDIIIYTYQGLDLSVYLNEASFANKSLQIEYFEKYYFSSIKGYNRLCLTVDFYRRVSSYKYMLIYQLDAWVFRDDLEYWCNLGYDYVGAPWFTNWGTYEDGETLWAVGNGGLSLRNNSFYIRFLNYKWPILHRVDFDKGFIQIIKSINMSCRTVKWWIRTVSDYTNEDYLLTNFFNFSNTKELMPNLPTTHIAAKFSFEKSPAYLYELCENQLPFGCHAFEKYEYEKFWKKYITL